MDYYGFYTGTEFEAYKYLGAHCYGDVTVFRTFAPSAERISLIGEFSNWDEIPMYKVGDGNFWECQVSGVKQFDMYKYRIYKRGGHIVNHCDPYGYYAELRPGTASKIFDSKYKFTDEKWIASRGDFYNKPINIYELHFGSWKTKEDAETVEEGWYLYEELADVLIPYLKENGYNYVEIMPLNEYPCDESWGYQGTGFFSATARYGDPDGLREFIDKCHNNNIGIILDFVPVHFALDGYALCNYDGTALYEYPNSAVGKSEWGSCNFMHSRGEVRSFLQSAAYFWLNEFHMDGLRMDAVSNLIYWQGDPNRGVNGMTCDFIKNMNCGLKQRLPGIMLIAEDSSSYDGVTRPVFDGGLGFDFKWDLGWMNDTLDYFRLSPEDRKSAYHKLTFSMMYYYNERYILPFSHDEVVHGKATIIQKMNGEYDVKFPQARALYLYMITHPGKKLNFMGNEIAQFREWDEKREQDWDILKYPKHDAFHKYIKQINRIYLETPALYGSDFSRDGFYWLDCHSEDKCVYSFMRSCGESRVAAIFNFSNNTVSYKLNVGNIKELTEIICSEDSCFDGCVSEKIKPVIKDDVAEFILPPFSGQIYNIEY